MHSGGYGTWFVSVSVCLSVVFYHHARENKIAIPKDSALHWLDFEFGEFRKSTAFKGYGVDKANSTDLHVHDVTTRSACSAYLRGTRNCNAGRVSTLASSSVTSL